VLQKGFAHFKEIVNNCAELNNIEFLHLGMQNQSMEQVKFIEVTLKNGASQMVRELKNNNVNLVFIGSIWRETFGYIAYEAAQAGAAIITFENSGNVAAFVKEFNIGAVVKNTNEFYQKLLESDFEEKLNEWLGNVNNLIFKNNKSFMSKGVLE
jgi:glycosyltransferase involved in cell wall biosynthesis